MRMGACCVVETYTCRASGGNDAPVGVCFGCGMDVCTAKECSTRMTWYTFKGKKRICATCAREFFTWERKVKLEQFITFDPAFNNKETGRGGCLMRMGVKGPKGAVVFELLTGWMLPSDRTKYVPPTCPIGVTYHHLNDRGIGELARNPHGCAYLSDNVPCYFRSNSALGDRLFAALAIEGDKGVWKLLTREYKTEFLPEKCS